MAKSVYIHIPFCRSICSYCDFTKILYDEKYTKPYLYKLKDEIEEFYNKEEIETLYIGGGTPSCLNEEELSILGDIVNLFNIPRRCEFTFECNIQDINESLLKKLKKMKVNRLSIGIESFDKCKLEFMNRMTSFEDASSKIALARSYGFNNINLDLMYGIPGEKIKDTRRDLKYLLKLNPEHISTYSLIIEEHTMCKIKNYENIDPEEELKMYDYIRYKLKRKGYSHYEISNFSKPGYESKHNLTYWNNGEYYGFGLGASGYIEGFRYENSKNIDDYLLGKYKHTKELLGKQEMMENEVMLGLRKIEGINIEDFFKKYDVNIQDVFPVKPLIKNGELIYKNGYIYINPQYIYVMNEILLKLI